MSDSQNDNTTEVTGENESPNSRTENYLEKIMGDSFNKLAIAFAKEKLSRQVNHGDKTHSNRRTSNNSNKTLTSPKQFSQIKHFQNEET